MMPPVPGPDTDRLIETHRSYAHAIAAEVQRKFPGVERDDLRSAAELGLVEAANSFDPSRRVLFKTFAYYRIRGAMFDSLRKMGWFAKDPARSRFESGINDYMKDYSEGTSADASPGQTLAEVEDLAASAVNCYFLSLTSLNEELPEKESGSGSGSPEEQYLRKESYENMRRALAQLPAKNRQVLEDYYFRDETLESIGQRLGLSKSWVSRLHAKGLDMLRAILTQGNLSKAVG